MQLGFREVLECAFAGWFVAIAVISLITGIFTRSIPSLAYTVVMVMAAALELFGVAHGTIGGRYLGSTLTAGYLISAVGFAFILLDTMKYAPQLGRVAIGVLAGVLLLIALGLVWPEWSRFFIVDRVSLALLLAMLGILGARAVFNDSSAVPLVYVFALLGPVVGIMLWSGFAFDWGLLWESVFFAGAVALRNHTIEIERDRFATLASNDGLTGVSNRRTFDRRLEETWAIASRAQIPIAIAMVDIDFFKKLNDTHGHQHGDDVLRNVARLCNSAFRRKEDCFARYGGEEFVAILVNVTLQTAVTFAETMRALVEKDAGVTVSIGVSAGIPAAHTSSAEFLHRADEALYRAKESGRNRVASIGPVNLVKTG